MPTRKTLFSGQRDTWHVGIPARKRLLHQARTERMIVLNEEDMEP